MISKNASILFSLCFSLTFLSCGAFKNGINLFTIDDDIALGKQVSEQIASDPKQFPLLPEQGNEEVYRYVRNITSKLLHTGKVAYSKEFPWDVKLIKDDTTLNAFSVPGGHLYVYTGLIKYLDSEYQLAGVMGHEIAHAALRHSTRQMTSLYGLDAVRQVITGQTDSGMAEQIALGLASLKFSRNHEAQADEYSVVYLCSTNYNAAGAAGFFKKIAGKDGAPPEFLSTHPDPGNRINSIEKKKQELGCSGTATNKSQYEHIKSLLK